jgi:methylmalonyl-CoA carboxyltransferase large subunit
VSDPVDDAALLEREAELGGGEARQQRQQLLGRLPVRERIAALVDDGSFFELDRYTRHRRPTTSRLLAAERAVGDGLVSGFARIGGVAVAVYGHDPTVLRGAQGEAGCARIVRLLHEARARRTPVVCLADSDGARVPEALDALWPNAAVMQATAELQGEVPLLTLACGLCVGAAAYTAALHDVVAMVRDRSFLFVTGPRVTKAAVGEDVTIEALGGADMHATVTGSAHAIVDDEAAGIAWLKRIVSFAAGTAGTDVIAPPTPKETLVPANLRQPYDVRRVLGGVFDVDSVLTIADGFGAACVVGFARLAGRAVAFVASQPMVQAGMLDVAASRKIARHVRLASRWGLPVVTFVDVPGFMPGLAAERGGILTFGKEIVEAYAHARVPTISVVLRKNYGGGSVLAFGSGLRLSLPHVRMAPMGVDAALDVELGPVRPNACDADRALREQLREQWLAEHDSARGAAERGLVDQIVPLVALRETLTQAMALPPRR